ncbi:MAG: hypothetical protein ABJH98_07220 [Reichenbachiella sp.]|uniref:hypothetical protein n=1 Tax=Reichenbachiella sp. TaxID=2184521 RepID=UPI0032977834
MKNKIDIESFDRKNIHQVPDGYFDELPLKIQSRISEQQKAHSPISISRMQIAWSMTAAIAIFFIGWILYPNNNNPSAEQLLASIDSQDLIEYLYEEDISTDEILASLDESYYLKELNSLETEFIDENLSNEDLESMYSELDYSTEIM